jgi:hypothetical protein
MDAPIEWLLAGLPWVEYRTRVDLLRQPEDEPLVLTARQAMWSHAQVQSLLAELAEWPGSLLTGHKSAGHPLHKLTFLADLGLRTSDGGVDRIVDRVLEHQDEAGPFQVLMNVPVHFGGSGQDEWGWALCDAPLVLYALVKLGLGGDPRVLTAVQHLMSLVRDNGWPCAVSRELGTFRGPGRKDDPCPYANLAMLKLLSLGPEWRESEAARTGAETLLALWDRRAERHPYLFYMGTDFCKLKAPLVWYDIVHVTDVLTRFPWLREDDRLRAMVSMIRDKADADGRFTPESVWTAWKDWDCGQKKAPSQWLTALAWAVIARVG